MWAGSSLSQAHCESRHATPHAATWALSPQTLLAAFLISTEDKRGSETLVFSTPNRVPVPWKSVSLNHPVSLMLINYHDNNYM